MESTTPSPTSACNDGIDNDEDGAIDLEDPGCSSSDDDNEAEVASTLAISTECVVSNINGSKTAYFTYENLTDQELFRETNETNGTVNTFVGSDSMVLPPDRFKTGLNRGAVAVTFQGDSLSWIVQSSDGTKQEALVSTETAECQPITPFVSCRTLTEDGSAASVGYAHENQFDLSLPVGGLNQFRGESMDLGQPAIFYPGVQSDVFNIPVPKDGSSLIWDLNGTTLEINASIPLCEGVCEEYSTEEIARAIRSIAKGLISTTDTAVYLRAAADGSKKPSVTLRYKQAKARKYRALLYRRLSDVPASARTCPGMRNQCEVVDLVSTIDDIKRLQQRIRNVAVNVLNTMRCSDSHTQAKSAKLRQKARNLGTQGIAVANTIPTSTMNCS